LVGFAEGFCVGLADGFAEGFSVGAGAASPGLTHAHSARSNANCTARTKPDTREAMAAAKKALSHSTCSPRKENYTLTFVVFAGYL
jgi:hypothetical protein